MPVLDRYYVSASGGESAYRTNDLDQAISEALRRARVNAPVYVWDKLNPNTPAHVCAFVACEKDRGKECGKT